MNNIKLYLIILSFIIVSCQNNTQSSGDRMTPKVALEKSKVKIEVGGQIFRDLNGSLVEQIWTYLHLRTQYD